MNVAEQELLDQIKRTTVLGPLGIDIVEATAEKVVLTVEVGPKVHQPLGYLHGGVSVLLAETGSSFGCWLAAGLDSSVLGVEINANHLNSIREGRITSTSVPIKQGRTLAVWETKIVDDDDRLICISRSTVAIREKKD